MTRKFIVTVFGVGQVEAFAETHDQAKAEVARELVENHRAPNFLWACNNLIASCRVDRPDPVQQAVYDVLRSEMGWAGAQGAEGAQGVVLGKDSKRMSESAFQRNVAPSAPSAPSAPNPLGEGGAKSLGMASSQTGDGHEKNRKHSIRGGDHG